MDLWSPYPLSLALQPNILPPPPKIEYRQMTKRGSCGVSGLCAMSTSETGGISNKRILDFGTGMLSLLKGPGELCPSSGGREDCQFCQIWRFRPFWPLTKVRQPRLSKLQHSSDNISSNWGWNPPYEVPRTQKISALLCLVTRLQNNASQGNLKPHVHKNRALQSEARDYYESKKKLFDY